MNEATCLKVISPKERENDFQKIAKILEDHYSVLATSRPIYDETTQKWHIFLNLFEKEPQRSARRMKRTEK